MRSVGGVCAGLLIAAALALTALLHLRHPDALVTMLPLPDMYDLHVDFDTFWHSAVALVHGADIYETPAKLTNLNPPLLTVLMTPFAAFDSLTAYRIFAGLTLLMVAGAVLAVARELRLSRAVTAGALLLVLAGSPLHGMLVLGQIYGILLVGLAAGWIAERRGRPVLAAVLYGVTVALKPSLAPVLLLALAQRRWVPLRAGLAAAAAATLLGVLVAGPGSGLEWLRIAFGEGVPDSVDNASLPGLSTRFGLTPLPGMLLGAGVLVLAAQGRRAAAAAAVAVALVPVSWNAEWAPDGLVADLARSLYCAILLGYWLLLLSSARSEAGGTSSVGAGGATSGALSVTGAASTSTSTSGSAG